MEFKKSDSNLIEIGQQNQKSLEGADRQTGFQTASNYKLSCTFFLQETGIE